MTENSEKPLRVSNDQCKKYLTQKTQILPKSVV